jgi:hypothetical protein
MVKEIMLFSTVPDLFRAPFFSSSPLPDDCRRSLDPTCQWLPLVRSTVWPSLRLSKPDVVTGQRHENFLFRHVTMPRKLHFHTHYLKTGMIFQESEKQCVFFIVQELRKVLSGQNVIQEQNSITLEDWLLITNGKHMGGTNSRST